MKKTIEHTLSKPSSKEQTRHSLIISMSKDIIRGYSDLKKAIAGGGNSKQHKKGTKRFIVNNQISNNAQQRENKRRKKRLSTTD